MAALPSVPLLTSISASVSNSATLASAFGRGSRLSRIARRGGDTASLATGNNDKLTQSSGDEGERKEQQTATRTSRERSRKWSTLRGEISPSPALMTITSKVQHIIRMLKKPPEDRSESDVKMLYQWLMSQEKLSALFTTMSEVSAKKLCKEMEFLHVSSGEVVVKQGEKGSTCFIVMSGIVSVYVRSPDEQERHQRLMRSSSISTSTRRLSVNTIVNYGKKVITLTPGATFGELCLIEPDSKRSATVIVDQQAQMANFIVLTAASYLRMTRSQTIEGTITDNIAFLQHLLIFKHWTKMQLMHIVNSMKFVNVSAGQYLTRKGADADSFFVFLRGEAVESVNLMVNESSEMSMGEVCGVQRSITVELTFLGKFDVAGEYLAAEKKISLCPVDIRATSDVDCLVLTRKMFLLHFGGKELKAHVVPTRKRLRSIGEAREGWRETRILQALQYPNLRVPITRKLMRLSGNCCLICGRRTHVAGDQLCMELPAYYMITEKHKKREQKEKGRRTSKHRLSIAQPSDGIVRRKPTMTTSPSKKDLPLLLEHEETQRARRLGIQLVSRQWEETEKNRVVRLPQRPKTTPSGTRAPPVRSTETSITRSSHIFRRHEVAEQQRRHLRKENDSKPRSTQEEIQHIRDTWPYCWNEDNMRQDTTKKTATRPSTSLEGRRNRPGRQGGSLSARN